MKERIRVEAITGKTQWTVEWINLTINWNQIFVNFLKSPEANFPHFNLIKSSHWSFSELNPIKMNYITTPSRRRENLLMNFQLNKQKIHKMISVSIKSYFSADNSRYSNSLKHFMELKANKLTQIAVSSGICLAPK